MSNDKKYVFCSKCSKFQIYENGSFECIADRALPDIQPCCCPDYLPRHVSCDDCRFCVMYESEFICDRGNEIENRFTPHVCDDYEETSKMSRFK